jgi:hypothetical protein
LGSPRVAIDDLFDTNETDRYNWRAVAKHSENGPFGGTIEDPVSSGAIQGISRWHLAETLKKLDLLERYDRFIVTRTDQYHACVLPLDALDDTKIWVPTGEDWGGICDRFFVAGKDYILQALNTHPPVILHPEQYYSFSGNIE